MGLLTPDFGLFFWSLVSFIVVLVILKKFAWKPILNMLNERETKIAESIAAAEKVQNEMSTLKADNERLLIEAREERSIMLREAKEMKSQILEDAKVQAQAEATKILNDARLQIENQKNAALVEVKNEIGTLAVEVAEKILRKELAQDGEQEHFVKMLADEIRLN